MADSQGNAAILKWRIKVGLCLTGAEAGLSHMLRLQSALIASVYITGSCEDDWSAKAAEDAIALETSIPQPAVVHRVTLEKLRAYANSAGKPGDRAERSRIRAMLEGK